MKSLSSLSTSKYTSDDAFTEKEKHKVLSALITHVYMQSTVAIMASIFCASIIFIGLYNFHNENNILFVWGTLFLIVAAIRLHISTQYKLNEYPFRRIIYWRNLYILGSLLGGSCWGFLGIYLFPHATPIQQTLMILMLAGVSAGSVPLSAAIPPAAIAFLLCSILPFIVTIALLKNNIYLLFDFALSLYLIYSIILTLNSHRLIKDSIILKYENDVLLTNLESTNLKLEYFATHDPLTKIANRRLFKTNLMLAIRHAREDNTNFAILFVDLDHFKAVNDTAGHNAGDQLLLIVIQKLRDYFGNADNISRLGGDEFGIIIENIGDIETIKVTAKKICQLISQPIEIDGTIFKVSASIGISIYPYDGEDDDSLLRSADKNMYHIKVEGGNNFYSSKELVE